MYTLKNSENLDFVAKITAVGSMIKNENISRLSAYINMFFRDIIAVAFVLVFKYSGVQKGLCISVPFIVALQNSSIYTICLESGMSVLNLIITYLMKDTAAAFLIILFCFVTAGDILSDRYNIKRDLQKITVYFTGIITVYIIDFAIKFFTV